MSGKQKSSFSDSKRKEAKETVSVNLNTNKGMDNDGKNCTDDENPNSMYAKYYLYQKELAQKQKIYSSVDLSKLPDGGSRLKKQMDDLECAIQNLGNVVSVDTSDNNTNTVLCEKPLKKDSEKNICDQPKEGSKSSLCGKFNQFDKSRDSVDEKLECVKTSYSNDNRERLFSLKGTSNMHLKNSFSACSKKTHQEVNSDVNKIGMDDICSALDSVNISKNNKYQAPSAKFMSGVGLIHDKEIICNDAKSVPSAKQKLTIVKDCMFTNETSASVPKIDRTASVNSENGCSSKQFSTSVNVSAFPISVRKDLSFSDLIANDNNKIDPSCAQNEARHPHWTNWRESSGNRQIKLVEAQELPNPDLGKQGKAKQNVFFPTYVSNSMSIGKEQLLKLHDSLKTCPAEGAEESDPEELITKLLKHQRQALAWLLWREGQQPRGGIFADDMGLGKTLTMISLVLKQRNITIEDSSQVIPKNVSSNATLIVCLASVVHQWNGEVVKHCQEGSLKVIVYHGKNRNKDVKTLAKQDIVLTTYSLIQSEGKALTNSKEIPALFKICWKRIVLDEAHTIKNEKSMTAKCICFLKASCRWAVTGTPIHNNLKDMYSLLKFLQCSPFDDYKVWKKFTGDESKRSVERRNALMKSILFRRSKEQCDATGKPLIKLPKKSIITHEIELEKPERKVYDELYNESKAKMKTYFDQKGDAVGSAMNPQISSSMSLLVVLLRLQQCCNHISLLQKEIEDDVSFNDSAFSDIADNLSSLSIHEKGNSSKSMQHDSSLNLSLDKYKSKEKFSKAVPSTKIKVLFEELNKISMQSSKQKCVIISQWVSMLEIIEFHLQQHKMLYHIIKGSTKPEDRMKIVTDFNDNLDGPKILLLSLKAGGVGLNLIGANHLFLLDIHWNPALESQACDRIYRVGQKLDCFVHKFVCRDTIETKILNLQEEKKYLAKNTLDCADKISQRPSFEDLKHLFAI